MSFTSELYPTILELATLHYRNGSFDQALAVIEELKNSNKLDHALAHIGGLSAFRLGDMPQAREYLETALSISPDESISWNVLGEVHRVNKDLFASIKAFQRAVTLDPNYADAFSNLGNLYSDASDFENAIASYQKALSINPQHIDAWYNLGNVTLRLNRFSTALEAYQKVFELAPHHLGALNNYGVLLGQLKQYDDAATTFNKLLALQPDHVEGLASYAAIFQEMGKLDEGMSLIDRGLSCVPRHAALPLLLRKAALYRELGNRDATKQAYLDALAIDPDSEEAASGLVNIDIALGNFISARAKAIQICDKFPSKLGLHFTRCFLELPVIYKNSEEIATAREAYTKLLTDLAARIEVLSEHELNGVEEIIGSSQPFFLPYQALDNKTLQESYGTIVANLMSRRFNPAKLPEITPLAGRRVRVGIVSGFYRNHSNYKIPIRGWLRGIDRQQFEVFCYHTQVRVDEFTHEASTLASHFVQGPKSLHEWAQLIANDHLDVLVYPEIGMDPTTCRLACLRLAPNQATSWGHPETSGLPTIDYFLSSALMEPDESERYYTETLVRLPNLSFSYEAPTRAKLAITRQDIGLSSDDFVYWCCQTNYKYLPQFDWVLPEIALKVPRAKFLFIQIQGTSEASQILRDRLEKAFSDKGLKASDFIQYLAGLDPDHFATVASLCDVALDTFEWSGCNSSLETLAQGIPIVTCPSTFMRSRHTAAILTMIGCTDTITNTPQEYVRLAVSLARDPLLHQRTREGVVRGISKAYGDQECIKGLQDTLITWISDPKKS